MSSLGTEEFFLRLFSGGKEWGGCCAGAAGSGVRGAGGAQWAAGGVANDSVREDRFSALTDGVERSSD